MGHSTSVLVPCSCFGFRPSPISKMGIAAPYFSAHVRWRWALVSPDGVVPSRIVGVSSSVNLPLHHKDQKFSSGTSSTRWSRKKGRKMVVVWWSILAKRLPISATAELFVCIVHHRASLYFTMGRPSPLKIAPFHGGSKPPSNIWFLGPNGVPNPNGISIGSTIFAGLTRVTDRQTDRLRYLVSSYRPHLRTMWPKNIARIAKGICPYLAIIFNRFQGPLYRSK